MMVIFSKNKLAYELTSISVQCLCMVFVKNVQKTDQIFHQTQQNYFHHLDQKWCSQKIEYLDQNKVLNYDIQQSNREQTIKMIPCQKLKIWLRNDNL